MSKLTSFIKEFLGGRGCKCAICNNDVAPHSKIVRVSTPQRQNGFICHEACWDAEVVTDFKYFESERHNLEGKCAEDANRCINHTVTVLIPWYAIIYFASVGMKIKKNGFGFKAVSPVCKNAYAMGKLIKACLKHGYKTYVNGDEVKTFAEYKAMTDLL